MSIWFDLQQPNLAWQHI